MKRRALITGASGVLGAAICRRLAADGYEVIAHANANLAAAQALAAEIGGSAVAFDVTDADATPTAIERLLEAGPIQVLVHNAGVHDDAPLAGMTPEQIFLGVFSKATDPTSGGRQMPSHWSSKELGIVSHSSPIATQVPHAAGIAYAMKYRNEDAVVASWFGEGATSEGDWHEGLNIAAIHRLPVVFICENNEYAISVPQSKQMAVADVATRAAGYGIPGFVVDGNDVLACFRVMKDAHDRARAGEGPTLIECKTYRFLPHTSDDDDKSYRSREEVEERRSHDPIERFATYLIDAGITDRDTIQAVHDEVKSQVEVAITAAWDAPDPDPSTATRNVFAEGDA